MEREDFVFLEVKTSRLFVARGAVSMKLRTFEGKGVKGELFTEYPISTDGSPVLVVNGEPYGPDDADFLLESATPRELKLLEAARYDLPGWGEQEGNGEFMDDDDLDEENPEDESEDY
jgi:hypothetical protein